MEGVPAPVKRHGRPEWREDARRQEDAKRQEEAAELPVQIHRSVLQTFVSLQFQTQNRFTLLLGLL
ncbi:hypothetical protein [Xanthobacter autotrophicus]|uniref:hypothetical protein n=1 Tax=Xanthobacter autotrophicus TaxID=280 RepID=UPI00372A2F4C